MQVVVRILRRTVVVVAWSAAAVGLLGVGLYLTALAVNRHDQPVSAEARELQGIHEALPAVADAENGYVYMLGFTAPQGSDARAAGAERAARLRAVGAEAAPSRASDRRQAAFPSLAAGQAEEAFTICPAGEQAACFEALREIEDVGAWLDERAWILARYSRLLSHGRWREIGLPRSGPSPVRLLPALRAQQAWHLEAWRRAGDHDAQGVREILREDVEFWRLVLADSLAAHSKLLATGALERHFAVANVVLQRLPAERVETAVPEAWRTPLTADERSMRRVLATQWRSERTWVRQLLAEDGDRPDADGAEQTLRHRLGRGLTRAFAQQQDFLNKRAHQFVYVAEQTEEPYDNLRAAFGRARAFDVFSSGDTSWSAPLYNFMLDTMLSRTSALDHYVNLAARVADLEGVRRAALLTAELRGRGVASGDVDAALARATLSDPYTGEPFEWEPQAGEIVFVGVHPSSHYARTALLY